MSRIVVSGADRHLLTRWSDGIYATGRDCLVLPVSALRTRLPSGSEVCLYDLGAQPDADVAELVNLVTSHPTVRFVAMTARPGATEGMQLLHAGVRGYCNRLASPQLLALLLATVEEGEIWAGKQVTEFLLQTSLAKSSAPEPNALAAADSLTAREKEISTQVGAGRSNKAIANDLGISERTVKSHLNAIFRKTGIHNRVQLALAFGTADAATEQRSSA